MKKLGQVRLSEFPILLIESTSFLSLGKKGAFGNLKAIS